MPSKKNPIIKRRDELESEEGRRVGLPEMAERAGVPFDTLRRWAYNRNGVSAANRRKLARTLSIPEAAWGPLPARGRPPASKGEWRRRYVQARALWRKGVSKREIARRLQLSPNDVLAAIGEPGWAA